MIATLAADSVVPFSYVKVIFAALLLMGWGKWATVVDKDAMFYHQARRMWNGVQLGAGAAAFFLLFMIPMFIIGFVGAILVIGGAAAAYIVVRNGSVDDKHRWRFDGEFFRQMILQKREEQAMRTATMRFPSPVKDLKPVPLSEDPEYGAHLVAESLLDPALERGAQRIDLAGTDQKFAAQMTIDGTDYRQPEMSPHDAVAMIDYLKRQAKMDVGDRRRKQIGETTIEFAHHGSHVLRVQTAGTTKGLTCTILIDPIAQLSIPLEELGLLDGQLEAIGPMIEQQEGVVLVAAPSRQGRTSTLYALVGKHDPYTQSVVTLEHSVERELEGVTQLAVESAQTAEELQTQLLRDPAVAMVAALSDSETARLAAKAGADGKRIYLGMKADDTFQALGMWLKAVGDNRAATKSLSAIIAQRLVRKLCSQCRQKFKPDAEALRKINLPADRISTLYKAGGQIQVKNDLQPCPSCKGRGFTGQTGAFEVLVLDDEARALIASGKIDELRSHLRRKKTLWLQEAALAKVVNGSTAIAEVMRVMTKEKK